MRKFVRVNMVEIADGALKSSHPALIDGADIKMVHEIACKEQPVVKVVFNDGSEIHCLGDLEHFKEGLSIAGLM